MTLNNLLETQGIIHSDPEIMSGVPVFVGTQVPLQTLFDYLESEGGLKEFINDFPYLETQTMKVLENALSSCKISKVEGTETGGIQIFKSIELKISCNCC